MDNLIKTEKAAKVLGVKPNTLAEWRRLDKSPPYYKINGIVRYSEAELREWMKNQRVEI